MALFATRRRLEAERNPGSAPPPPVVSFDAERFHSLFRNAVGRALGALSSARRVAPDGSPLAREVEEAAAVLSTLVEDAHACAIAPELADPAAPQIVAVDVNGRRVLVRSDVPLSYGDVLVEADYLPGSVRTVAFARGPAERREGSLRPGESVRAVDGMVFHVADTSSA